MSLDKTDSCGYEVFILEYINTAEINFANEFKYFSAKLTLEELRALRKLLTQTIINLVEDGSGE